MTTFAIVPQLAEQPLQPSPAHPIERRRQVHELIEANVTVARSMAARYRNRGIDLDDLEQVALVGLTKAAQRFDATAGHDFMAYAAPTIRGELRRHFRDSGWMIRVPRRLQELQARIATAEQDLLAALGRSPQPSEIADHLGADLDDVVEALSADGCFRPTSIDTTAGDGDDTIASLIGWHDPVSRRWRPGWCSTRPSRTFRSASGGSCTGASSTSAPRPRSPTSWGSRRRRSPGSWRASCASFAPTCPSRCPPPDGEAQSFGGSNAKTP